MLHLFGALCLVWVTGQSPGVVVETSDDVAYQIGEALRCPVCQGMPIAESPSPMAQDMMRRVRDMLAQGKNQTDINAYFAERYGEWVLLDPPLRGASLWVWFLPPVMLALGIALAFWQVRRLMQGRSSATRSARDAILPVLSEEDPTVRAIRQEVER